MGRMREVYVALPGLIHHFNVAIAAAPLFVVSTSQPSAGRQGVFLDASADSAVAGPRDVAGSVRLWSGAVLVGGR